MLYCHIHGFNSSPASATLRNIRQWFPQAQGLSYSAADRFDDNIRVLRAQVLELQLNPDNAGALVISGSSLGGFYASQLAALLGCNCALFNPVVRPAVSLQKYIGSQTNIYTGEAWEFTPAALESYLVFPDTRHSAPMLRRFLLLGRNDDVIDPREAREYWHGYATIHETSDGHSIGALDAETVEALRELAR